MFELSPDIDKNKIFLVNLSNIEGRLDPHPYHSERINTLKKLASLQNIQKLKKVVVSKKTTTNNISPNDIYIGLENIESNTGIYTPTKEKRDISSANIFYKGQILFPKLRPYLNKVYLAEFNGLCSTEFHIFTSKLVKPEFLTIYLRSNLIVSQTKHLMTGNTLPRLQTEDIENLPVPILPKETQQKIIKLYATAYKTKQQKEAEAELLLNSIDNYLLGELGISLPEKDNSLENRMFKVNFSEVTGGRFDPKLYDNYTKALKEAIDSSIYEKISLKKLIVHSISGDWGIDERDNPDENYIKCLVIRATEFDNVFNLNLENSRVKYRYIHKIKYIKMDIQPNDLLIEKSGGSPDQPVGRVSIITKEILENLTVGFSNFIHKIRVNEELINPEYLFYYLKTLHNIKLTDAMQSQTNGIRNLIMNDYYNLNIAIPETEQQYEIAEHIKTIKEQAKQLKSEAKEVLEQAKQEVEKMILGE